ncbi:MAG: hypothetical protein HXO23_05760 [Prevotella sp.]|nr:hypothetical protein [Prevotella sp.]
MIWGLLFILLLAAMFIGLNAFYKRTDYFKWQHLELESYKQGVPKQLDCGVFGSTYALYAFQAMPQYHSNNRFFNFSLNAESIEQDYLLFNKYKTHFNKRAFVLFTLAPCVCYYTYKASPQYNSYFLLSHKEIPNFKLSRYLSYRLPLLSDFKQIFRSLKFLLSEQEMSLDALFPPSVSEEVAKMNMKGLAEGWMHLFRLPNLREKNQDALNERALKENANDLKSMIDDCIQHEIVPVIVITPFAKELTDYFGKAFLDNGMYKLIQEAVGTHQVRVLDYLYDADYQNNRSLFADGGFRLNNAGSSLLCKKVMKELLEN